MDLDCIELSVSFINGLFPTPNNSSTTIVRCLHWKIVIIFVTAVWLPSSLGTHWRQPFPFFFGTACQYHTSYSIECIVF